MSGRACKKRKHVRDSICQFDQNLYKANYESAEFLNTKLFKCFESFTLPPCKFKQIAIYENISAVSNNERNRPSSNCAYCINKYDNCCVISHSNTVYLMLDFYKNCILKDQIIISPFKHVQSTLYLDENTYTEVRNFQKTLVHMFHEIDKAVIFIELSLRDKHFAGDVHNSQHCKIECYAIPKDLLDESKCYFLKEINECGSYWSQNKRIIEIHGKTGVRDHIPLGFDFIHVDYSLGGGIACVIDDHTKVKTTFGRDVITGILEMDALQRAFPRSEEHTRALDNIRKQYESYDWTKN